MLLTPGRPENRSIQASTETSREILPVSTRSAISQALTALSKIEPPFRQHVSMSVRNRGCSRSLPLSSHNAMWVSNRIEPLTS